MISIAIDQVNLESKEGKCLFCGEDGKRIVESKIPIQYTDRLPPRTKLIESGGMFTGYKTHRIVLDDFGFDDKILRTAGYCAICADCVGQLWARWAQDRTSAQTTAR